MNDRCEIPGDVWEGRCQWCVHRQGSENRAIPKAWIGRYQHDKDRPCRIMGISRPGEIEGECKNFAPHQIYGICKTCRHNNCFHEGYCLHDGQPNKRQVYIGQSAYNHKANYWQVHELSTCDAYEPDAYWFETMRRQALEGKIPRNFNPVTMAPVGEGFAETKAAIQAWTDADLAYSMDKERAEAEKRRRMAERIAADTNQLVGQMTMDF